MHICVAMLVSTRSSTGGIDRVLKELLTRVFREAAFVKTDYIAHRHALVLFHTLVHASRDTNAHEPYLLILRMTTGKRILICQVPHSPCP